MCGIAGIFDLTSERPVDAELLTRMTTRIAHRGPDDHGFHNEPGVGLGHRRLSIIDLAGGHQPIYNEDRTVAIIYNGEIYNYRPLTEELEAKGHVFASRTDSEVIVHAWEEWGTDCLSRFNGMFAFALWDRNRRQLFLARDRLGIKPLHYAPLRDGQVLFGSELKSLYEHPSLDRTIDPKAVEEYFTFGYVPDPRTIFQSVYKLPPGHFLLLERGAPMREPVRYWDVSFPQGNVATPADVGPELVDRLRAAVDRRLIAEVPLGAFLSGGVDSSAVVAMMAGLNDDPVRTCSISFGDPAFNEARYAAQVAEKFGTRHRVEQVDPDDFSLIDKLVDLYDEPYADSSAIPTYRVCELARRDVTVALSGDGGDENFIGYRRYRWAAYEERVRRVLPQGFRGPTFGLLGRLYPKMDWAPKVLRAKSTLQALARDSMEGYLHSVSLLPPALRSRLFSARLKSDLQGYEAIEVFRQHAASVPGLDGLPLIQYLDFKTYLPGDILTKVDRASMAHSLEVRVPLLDHEFVDWVASLPPGIKLDGREGKAVFKKALEPHLPNDILYRSKMGFAVPLAAWFRGPLRDVVRRSLLGGPLADSGLFDMAVVEDIVHSHQRGVMDHSSALWSLLMFDGFLKSGAMEQWSAAA